MTVWGLAIKQVEPDDDGGKYVQVRKEGVVVVEIEKIPIQPELGCRPLTGAIEFLLTKQEALDFADQLREEALRLPGTPPSTPIPAHHAPLGTTYRYTDPRRYRGTSGH